MKSPNEIPLSEEQRGNVAKIIASIEERAATDPRWPAVFGPVHLDRRVFEAVYKELQKAGWDAEFGENLIVNGARV